MNKSRALFQSVATSLVVGLGAHNAMAAQAAEPTKAAALQVTQNQPYFGINGKIPFGLQFTTAVAVPTLLTLWGITGFSLRNTRKEDKENAASLSVVASSGGDDDYSSIMPARPADDLTNPHSAASIGLGASISSLNNL